MTPENENYLAIRSTPNSILKPGNILDDAVGQLTAKQRSDLAAKAVESRVRLDEAEKLADLQDRVSTAQLVKTIQTARALDLTTKTDHRITDTIRTASGEMKVEIKKNNNTVIIVVAVAIAVVVVVLWRR